MKKSLLIVFLLIVVVPIFTISLLGFERYRRDKASTTERYRILARERLEEINRLIESHTQNTKREVSDVLAEIINLEQIDYKKLRNIMRGSDLVRRMFLIDSEGSYLFPPEAGPVSENERQFLSLAKELELASILRHGNESPVSNRAESYHWYTWFMGDGVNFVLWRITNEGVRIGAMIERVALISRIMRLLPDSDLVADETSATRIALTNALGSTLYQWGAYEPDNDAMHLSEIPVVQPFGAWHLRLYMDLDAEEMLTVWGEYLSLFSGLAALIVVVCFLSYYFYRENKKIVDDALRKVSFVNQVSHELRTPLTNIRLYAELLTGNIRDEKQARQLEIINSESRRLSRMINNVLTFSRIGKGKIVPRFATVFIDEIVRAVERSFALSLGAKDLEVVLTLDAPIPIHTDPDFLEQILSNLVGNAEKYAANGHLLEISTRQEENTTYIEVHDNGPGIPDRERKNIFKPFYQISNRLNDGVTGAGIGLSVSRELAEALGGDLELKRSSRGASFILTIPHMRRRNTDENTHC